MGSLLALAATGCAPDHRISFAEFLQLQAAVPPSEAAEPIEAEPAAASVDTYFEPYEVGSSDVLVVTLAGTDREGLTEPLQVRIDRQGEIDLPFIGSLQVANKTLEDVEDAIRNAYVPSVFQALVVHVGLVQADITEVLVLGAVTEGGLIPLRRNERNVLVAIVRAGGVSDRASGRATLRRIRRPADEETFDLRNPIELQQALALAPLESGDIIYVHAAELNSVFVGGLVNRTGPQTYPQDTEITILQALAAAGGLRTDVFPREGTLVRRLPDGTDVHVKLDLKKLALGQDENVALVPGDILWVPETWDTRLEDFINRNIFLRAGASVSYNVTGVEFLNRHRQQSARFGGSQEDISDPYGFLSRNSALQGIQGNLVLQQP